MNSVLLILFAKIIVFNKQSSCKLMQQDYKAHNNAVAYYFSFRQNLTTSNLGSILFKNAKSDEFIREGNKNYTVLVQWQNKEQTHRYYNFPNDPLEGCSVTNCVFLKDYGRVKDVDAVVVTKPDWTIIKLLSERSPEQRWILYNEESPINNRRLIFKFPAFFNWTMTYRTDSDIPVPYGRTVPLSSPIDVDLSDPSSALAQLVPNWSKKQFNVLSMIMISNCQVKSRLSFVYKLRRYMDVDVGGKCFLNETKRCYVDILKTHLPTDCKYTEEYVFYLAFENSSCRQYLTEKSFHLAYYKGAIPVIMGAPKEDCQNLLPPNSFLHVDDYETPKDLADHMFQISQDRARLLIYHEWRLHFAVVNEHGFFGTRSFHLCRVCEALNYNNNETKFYDSKELKQYLNEYRACDGPYNNKRYKIKKPGKKRKKPWKRNMW